MVCPSALLFLERDRIERTSQARTNNGGSPAAVSSCPPGPAAFLCEQNPLIWIHFQSILFLFPFAAVARPTVLSSRQSPLITREMVALSVDRFTIPRLWKSNAVRITRLAVPYFCNITAKEFLLENYRRFSFAYLFIEQFIGRLSGLTDLSQGLAYLTP